MPYNAPFNVNSNLYHICYRLWDNHVWTTEMTQIRNFVLQMEGQGNEVRCRRWRSYSKLNVLKLGEERADLSRPVSVLSIMEWHSYILFLTRATYREILSFFTFKITIEIDFIFYVNSSICLCHRLWDNHVRSSKTCWFEPLIFE